MRTIIKVVSSVAFYTTAFVLGGIIGWASNHFDDWVDEIMKTE